MVSFALPPSRASEPPPDLIVTGINVVLSLTVSTSSAVVDPSNAVASISIPPGCVVRAIFSLSAMVTSLPCTALSTIKIFSTPVVALKSDEPPFAVNSIVSVPVPPAIVSVAKKSSPLPLTVRFTLAELVTESSATPLSSPRIPSPLFLPVKITVVSAVHVLPVPPRTRANSPVSSNRLNVVAPPIAPSAVNV